MTKYAQNRTDLAVISELRSKLAHWLCELEVIDPDLGLQVDEDYKVAEHHSLTLVDLEHLQKLANLLEGQVDRVLSCVGKPRTEEDFILFGNTYKWKGNGWEYATEHHVCRVARKLEGFYATLYRKHGLLLVGIAATPDSVHRATAEAAVYDVCDGLINLCDMLVPKSRPLTVVTEAHKLCTFLANTEDELLEVEHLIDPLDQLAEKYAKKFLTDKSEEECRKAVVGLAAEQARHLLQRMHKALEKEIKKTCPACGSEKVNQLHCEDCGGPE
jgi:hypothetical protein